MGQEFLRRIEGMGNVETRDMGIGGGIYFYLIQGSMKICYFPLILQNTIFFINFLFLYALKKSNTLMLVLSSSFALFEIYNFY
jgi:hypothetical protein